MSFCRLWVNNDDIPIIEYDISDSVRRESDFSFVESYERDLAAIDHARFISCSLRITVSGINNKEIRSEQ